jgi:hypothetical protein
MRPCAIALCLLVAGCAPSLTREQLGDYQTRTLYTCCNIHYEHDELNDANYHVGTTLPLGTPVKVVGGVRGGFTFAAGPRTFTMYHAYGTEQETLTQFMDKLLVREDPTPVVERYPQAVQDAIRESRVEPGMTREQVIFSVGYPPTHRTPGTDAPEWTYWHNRWVTYRVVFDAAGTVSSLVGSSAPTRNVRVD